MFRVARLARPSGRAVLFLIPNITAKASHRLDTPTTTPPLRTVTLQKADGSDELIAELVRSNFKIEVRKESSMKKLMVLGFLFALAIGANAQPNAKTRPNAHGKGLKVSAPPTATVSPVAHRGGKKK